MAKIDLKVGDIVNLYDTDNKASQRVVAKNVILHHIPTLQPSEMKPFWHFEDPVTNINFYISGDIEIVLVTSV